MDEELFYESERIGDGRLPTAAQAVRRSPYNHRFLEAPLRSPRESGAVSQGNLRGEVDAGVHSVNHSPRRSQLVEVPDDHGHRSPRRSHFADPLDDVDPHRSPRRSHFSDARHASSGQRPSRRSHFSDAQHASPRQRTSRLSHFSEVEEADSNLDDWEGSSTPKSSSSPRAGATRRSRVSNQSGREQGRGQAPPTSTLLGKLCSCLPGATWCRRRRKRQQQQAQNNQWIDLGDRQKRLGSIRIHEHELSREEDDAMRERSIVWTTYCIKLAILRFWQSLEAAVGTIQEICGQVDRRTGLPAKLLRKHHFVSLKSTTCHGFLFMAKDLHSSGSAGAVSASSQARDGVGRGHFVAIRVRTKTNGKVARLPLGNAARVLRANVLKMSRILEASQKILSHCGIGHPPFSSGYIVQQIQVFNTPEFFIEVTEYLDGGSLHDYMKESDTINEFTACKLMARLFRALHYLHSRRLMHRDVRVQQILLACDDKGQPDLATAKLGDFWCLAKIPRSGTLVENRRPVEISTTAPEVLSAGLWSAEADMWSAGCVFFEVLYGHPPYGGKKDQLVDSICHTQPEFDRVCGGTSTAEAVVKLVKLLLRKHHRPSAENALNTKCIVDAEFEKHVPRTSTPDRIKYVRLMGTPQESKKGMGVENILKARPGEVNAGFCTNKGKLFASMDLEIGREEPLMVYWVTTILVSLWGTPDNPKKVKVQMSGTRGAPFEDCAKVDVQSQHDTQVSIQIGRPLRYARLQFAGNFGGMFGIAIRKIIVYGYEICTINVMVDVDNVNNEGGAGLVEVASGIEEDQLRPVHSTIRPLLEEGERVQGNLKKYMKYRCVCGGKAGSTAEIPMRLEVPDDCREIIAATFDLTYVCELPLHGLAPKMKLILIQMPSEEEENGTPVRSVLFEVEYLPGTERKLQEVVKRGFVHFTMLSNLHFKQRCGEHELRVELAFSNRSGCVHIPVDIGLTFYYLPELDSDSSGDETSSPRSSPYRSPHHSPGHSPGQSPRGGRVGRQHMSHRRSDRGLADDEEEEEEEDIIVFQQEKKKEIDLFSEDEESVKYEDELKADENHNLQIALYGGIGTSVAPVKDEMDVWVSPSMHIQGAVDKFEKQYNKVMGQRKQQQIAARLMAKHAELGFTTNPGSQTIDTFSVPPEYWWRAGSQSFSETSDSTSAQSTATLTGGDEQNQVDDEDAGKVVSLRICIEGASNLRSVNETDGMSDPMCVCTVPGRPKFRTVTRTVPNSLDPHWDHRFQFDHLRPADKLHFQVLDAQFVQHDDEGDGEVPGELLGSVSMRVKDILLYEAGFKHREYPLHHAGKGKAGDTTEASITLTFKCEYYGPPPHGEDASPKTQLWPPDDTADELRENAQEMLRGLDALRAEQHSMRTCVRREFLKRTEETRRAKMGFVQRFCATCASDVDDVCDRDRIAACGQQCAAPLPLPWCQERGDDEEFMGSGEDLESGSRHDLIVESQAAATDSGLLSPIRESEHEEEADYGWW